jgi:hypothetical protein
VTKLVEQQEREEYQERPYDELFPFLRSETIIDTTYLPKEFYNDHPDVVEVRRKREREKGRREKGEREKKERKEIGRSYCEILISLSIFLSLSLSLSLPPPTASTSS